MSRQYWNETLVDGPLAAGTLFNTYTTAKSVSPAGCALSVPPNFFIPGKMLRMTILGAESHATGNTQTFQFEVGAVAAFSSGALPMTTTTHTTIPFKAVCDVTCRVGGATAQLMGQWVVQGSGYCMGTPGADFSAGSGFAMGPLTAPALGTAFDATVTQTIDFYAAMSTSAAGLGIQVHQYMLEALN